MPARARLINPDDFPMNSWGVSVISWKFLFRLGAVHKRIECLVLLQHDSSVKVLDTVMVSEEMFL